MDLWSTPSYAYLTHDHLGSTRGLWDGSIANLGTWEFDPYGSPFHFNGPAGVTQLYTGHDLDPVTGQYYAPFRYLDPAIGRWESIEPLGMVDGTNMHSYVRGNPIMLSDPTGLYSSLHNPAGAAVAAELGVLTGGATLASIFGLGKPKVPGGGRDGGPGGGGGGGPRPGGAGNGNDGPPRPPSPPIAATPCPSNGGPPSDQDEPWNWPDAPHVGAKHPNDPNHHFPQSLNQLIMQGRVPVRGNGPYFQYNAPGVYRGVPGVFQLGVNTQSMTIVHRVFMPGLASL